jgi:hypothetical protein
MYTNYNTHTVMYIIYILFHKYAFGIKSADDEVIKCDFKSIGNELSV